ncbi:MAG TPA: glycosyltransferase, partial [Gammaproteobacteria bacterium]|nr:glycosyltransferase [Gammaproteobacteria bacterium]
EVVILLRQYNKLDELAQRFPKARLYFWLHNMPSQQLYQAREALVKHRYQIIAVSHFHRAAIERKLQGKWFHKLFAFSHSDQIPIQVIYNPIEDSLQPDATPVQAEQLLFMSSPHKGLPETLKLFQAVQAVFPEYQLLIANPGYTSLPISLPPQARLLGALPHHQIIQELRRSFCVFYPQTIRTETFGLVYAEANAVGTPVLAHDMGAAREVLSDKQQLVNGRRLSDLLDKLSSWRQKRPLLQGKKEFRLSQVIQAWLQLVAQ